MNNIRLECGSKINIKKKSLENIGWFSFFFIVAKSYPVWGKKKEKGKILLCYSFLFMLQVKKKYYSLKVDFFLLGYLCDFRELNAFNISFDNLSLVIKISWNKICLFLYY